MLSDNKSHAEIFVIEFLMGGFAAAISKTIASPIQVIKIRLQLQPALAQKGAIDKPYLGIVDCFKKLYVQDGIKAYYKGNLTNVVRYFPTQALNFSFKAFYKRVFQTKAEKSFIGNVLSGSAAGASTQFFVYPLDYIRTRLTNDMRLAQLGGHRQYQGMADCVVKTYQTDGVRGLYRGFGPSVLCMIIYRGLYFGLYDTLKPLLPAQYEHNVGVTFALSYLITVISGASSYPLDTIRRRMMMTSGERLKFNNSIECAKSIYLEHGIPSFFRGVAANIMRGVTGAGVLTINERMQVYLFGRKYGSGEG